MNGPELVEALDKISLLPTPGNQPKQGCLFCGGKVWDIWTEKHFELGLDNPVCFPCHQAEEDLRFSESHFNMNQETRYTKWHWLTHGDYSPYCDHCVLENSS